MISALHRIPKARRREVARIWGRRGLEAQARLRMERGPDEETERRRALEDRRGQVVREGRTYTAAGVTHWQVMHSRHGRVDQFDLVANGRLVWTRGPRRLPRRFRPDAAELRGFRAARDSFRCSLRSATGEADAAELRGTTRVRGGVGACGRGGVGSGW